MIVNNVVAKQRRDIASNWSLNNPVLLEGEIGIATDVSGFKVGDGITAWNNLSFFYKKGYSQKTKLNCWAGDRFIIPMESSPAFLYAPLEVLKFAPAETGKVITMCSYDNADSGSFTYTAGQVTFDGVMKLSRAEEEITFSTPITLVDGYVCSANVDVTGYHELLDYVSPEYMKVADVYGSAMTSSTTWEQYAERNDVVKTSLYVKNDNAYGVVNGVFSALTTTWSSLTNNEKWTLFNSTTGEATAEDLISLGTFTIFSYSAENTAPKYTLIYLPFPQLILPTGTISLTNFELSKVEMVYGISGVSRIKIAVTNDLQTYYTYNATSGEFEQIMGAITVEKVLEQGIDISELANIPQSAWEGTTTIGFAYALSQGYGNETCYTDELILTVDANGAWKKAIHGTDYDYIYDENSNAVFSVLTAGDYKVNFMS